MLFVCSESLIHRGMLLLSEDAAIILAIHQIIRDVVHYHGSFLFEYQAGYFRNEFLWISFEHQELGRTYL